MYDPGNHKTLTAIIVISQRINAGLRVLRQEPSPFISLPGLRPNPLRK